jgi:hypothetical protein
MEGVGVAEVRVIPTNAEVVDLAHEMARSPEGKPTTLRGLIALCEATDDQLRDAADLEDALRADMARHGYGVPIGG